eukprot:ctg_1754.g522
MAPTAVPDVGIDGKRERWATADGGTLSDPYRQLLAAVQGASDECPFRPLNGADVVAAAAAGVGADGGVRSAAAQVGGAGALASVLVGRRALSGAGTAAGAGVLVDRGAFRRRRPNGLTAAAHQLFGAAGCQRGAHSGVQPRVAVRDALFLRPFRPVVSGQGGGARHARVWQCGGGVVGDLRAALRGQVARQRAQRDSAAGAAVPARIVAAAGGVPRADHHQRHRCGVLQDRWSVQSGSAGAAGGHPVSVSKLPPRYGGRRGHRAERAAHVSAAVQPDASAVSAGTTAVRSRARPSALVRRARAHRYRPRAGGTGDAARSDRCVVSKGGIRRRRLGHRARDECGAAAVRWMDRAAHSGRRGTGGDCGGDRARVCGRRW